MRNHTVITEPCRRVFLLAVLSVALLWGWATEAAIFTLTWAGLLRIGAALRSDLVLPEDASPGTTFALLRIRQPKTRGRSAKHQAARVDPVDVITLLSTVFAKLPAGSKLWPMSVGTLRRRLQLILKRLQLCTGDRFHFDLASFRPGGATWMLNMTENAELVRRRGRWLSARVMEIYLQEIVAAIYVPQLQAAQRSVIQGLADAFPYILDRIVFFENTMIPRSAWFFLLTGP